MHTVWYVGGWKGDKVVDVSAVQVCVNKRYYTLEKQSPL